MCLTELYISSFCHFDKTTTTTTYSKFVEKTVQILKFANIKVKIKVKVLATPIFINVVLTRKFQAKVKYVGQQQQQLGSGLQT